MNRLPLSLALAVAFLTLSSSAPRSQEQTEARRHLAELLETWRSANYLDVKAHVTQIEIQLPGPEDPPRGLPGVPDKEVARSTQKLELHLARPLSGWGSLEVEGLGSVGIENELIADGESVFVLHPVTDAEELAGTRDCLLVGESFARGFGETLPLLAWSTPELSIAPKAVEAIADPTRPELAGLRLRFDDRSEELWTDAAGRPVESTITWSAEKAEIRTTYTFEQFDAAENGDLDRYRRELPEGCNLRAGPVARHLPVWRGRCSSPFLPERSPRQCAACHVDAEPRPRDGLRKLAPKR